MPFTVSHAIVALPFARSAAIPVGAVAVGAMAPDLPLFVPFGFSYQQTHGIPSFLYASLITAFVLFAIWRALLRPAAAALTPRFVAERLPREWGGNAASGIRSLWAGARMPAGRVSLSVALARLALVVAALLIGVATHLCWDEFTHPGRLGEQLIPALGNHWAGIPLTVWLQYLSSAAGLLVLAVWAWRWLLRHPRAPDATEPRALRAVRVGYWLALLLALVASAVIFVAIGGMPSSRGDAVDFALAAGPPAGALMLAETAVAAIAVQIIREAGT